MEMVENKKENKEEGKKEMNFDKIAQKNFVLWNKALLSKKPEEVAKLYSEDCSFLPTMSPDFKHGQKEAEEYFEHFLQKNPEGKIISEAIQVVPAGSLMHSGRYDFEVGPKSDRSIVEARFSFLWDPNGKIMHHHSSQMDKAEGFIPAEKNREDITKIAEEYFKNWNGALLTKDPTKVVALYSSDCTFLPTLSPDFKNGQEETKEYFDHFLQKNPEGKVIEETVQVVPAGSLMHSGRYDFEIGSEGDRSIVEARFSFLWALDGKILHHHSSVKPQ